MLRGKPEGMLVHEGEALNPQLELSEGQGPQVGQERVLSVGVNDD
eukprot:CAMPEP_0119324080 /NCGR_PEP_ID=MMETSP1333-20130426/62305_1 /TAXON_ID=418940 /ORGANISM="Scyphosphaera apsteinii, Strain RCC1455" /LENGTH=44 /DNA_ID= /DNA_START= /DNA_END= /DNA_ORIENTATION=